jgi:hypothetical protein
MAQVYRTFCQCFFAVKDFAGDFGARFGGSAQICFVECGGFHHGIERFCVVTLPCFVSCLNLNFAALSAVQSIGILAPKYVICNCFEFVLGERDFLKFGTLNISFHEVFAVVGPVD